MAHRDAPFFSLCLCQKPQLLVFPPYIYFSFYLFIRFSDPQTAYAYVSCDSWKLFVHTCGIFFPRQINEDVNPRPRWHPALGTSEACSRSSQMMYLIPLYSNGRRSSVYGNVDKKIKKKKKKKARKARECEMVRKEMFSSQRSVCVRRVSLLPAQPSRLCAPLGGVAARHPSADPDIANAQHLSLWQSGAP